MSNMLYILSASLAESIGKDERVCRGLLRLTIVDSVDALRQTSDLNQAVDYIKKMSYQDWKSIIEGQKLSQRLANIGFKDSSSIVARLRQTLVEQQSLLTMTAY